MVNDSKIGHLKREPFLESMTEGSKQKHGFEDFKCEYKMQR